MTSQLIPQKEFAEKHGILPVRMKGFRNKHLSPDEWEKKGISIYWKREAVERVERMLAGDVEPEPDRDLDELTERLAGFDFSPENNPDAIPCEVAHTDEGRTFTIPVILCDSTPNIPQSTINVRVIGLARNSRYVYADSDGQRIEVKLDGKARPNMVGKLLCVTAHHEDGETKYTQSP